MIGLTGTIDRRILVTVRVEPTWLATRLPDGFEPTVVDGAAVGGLCLLRWQRLRPAGWPAAAGIMVDGVAERWFAHRVDAPDRPGVVVTRRAFDGIGRAAAAGLATRGEVERLQIRDTVHHDELHVEARAGRGADSAVQVGVRPTVGHDGSVIGGHRGRIDELHRCTTRGWTTRKDGAGVSAAELDVTGAWHATPVELVAFDQRWLPDHAEVDHVLVMSGLEASYRSVPA